MTVRTVRGAPVITEQLRPSPSAVVAATCGLLVVVLFGFLVAPLHGWTTWELAGVQWMSAHHVRVLSDVATAVDVGFSPVGALVLLSGLCAGVATRDGLRRGALTFLIAGTSWVGSWVLKVATHRPRPDVALLADPPPVDTSFAFPSGHTVFATVFVLTAALAAGPRARRWSVPVGVALIATTAASRVYLGVHYPSDVLGGVLYGICAFVLVSAVLTTSKGRRLLTVVRLGAAAKSTTPAPEPQPREGERA